MSKEYVKIYLVLFVAVVIGLTAYMANQQTSKFSEQEEKAFMDDYIAFVQSGAAPEEVEKKMNKGIDKLSLENSSNAVDGLFYSIYQVLPLLNQKAEGLQASLVRYGETKDFSKEKDVRSIDDATIRAFLNEVKKNQSLLVFQDGKYHVNPNLEKLVTTYKPYMSEAMLAQAEFYQLEYIEMFFDPSTQAFNFDVLVERILLLEKNLVKFPQGYYTDWFRASKAYYYKIYFAQDNEALLDSEKRLRKDLQEHYASTMKNYPDSTLAKDLQAYVELLEETDFMITDNIGVYLLDLTKAPAGTEAQLGENGEMATPNSDDPLKNALKENGK